MKRIRVWGGIGLFLFWGMAMSFGEGELSEGMVFPKNGSTNLTFYFTVVYNHPTNALPDSISVVVDRYWTNGMTEVDVLDTNTVDGKLYRWQGVLSKGRHIHRFQASPAATGEVFNSNGPVVSDQGLFLRSFFYFQQFFPHPMIDTFDLEHASSMGIAGDLNGDGYTDMFHAWPEAPVDDTDNEGFVVFYMGPYFQQSYTMLHPDTPQLVFFGIQAIGVGDLNADGCDDFAVGDSNLVIHIYHGQTSGPPVHVQQISAPVDVDHRHAPAGGADINGDGYSDLLVDEDIPVGDESGYRLRVRYGPGLSNSAVSLVGSLGSQVFVPERDNPPLMTDFNLDGNMDLLFPGTRHDVVCPGGECYSTNYVYEVMAVYGPDLSSVSTISSTPLPATHPAGFRLLGDVNQDGYDDFVAGDGTTVYPPYTILHWYTGPTLTDQGVINYPVGLTNQLIDWYGAGDMDADGSGDLFLTHNASSYYTDDEGYVVRSSQYGSFFDTNAMCTSLWASLNSYDRLVMYADQRSDLDGNGLTDAIIADADSSLGPLNTSAGISLGTVQIVSPCYPYPITSNDLPSRLLGRCAGLTMDFTSLPIDTSLSPNGTISIITGQEDRNGRVPFIMPAETLVIPDKPYGEQSGDPLFWRVESAGQDGSGWINLTAVPVGAVEMTMLFKVSVVKVTDSGETVMSEDIIRLSFASDVPFDFSSGYLEMSGTGRAPSFAARMGYANTPMVIHLAAYMDFTRTLGRQELVRVPAELEFGSVATGAVAGAQQVDLVNLGDEDLIITDLQWAGNMFTITNMPSLPMTISSETATSLWVTFAPQAIGSYCATVEIVSDDPQVPTQTVSLCGSALADGLSDFDGDGMPDVFEEEYAVPTVSGCQGLKTNEWDSHLDYDLDGQNNRNEYYSGMDPTDSGSVFQVTGLAGFANGLQWTSASNRTYSIQRSTHPSGPYSVYQSDIVPNPPTNTASLPQFNGTWYWTIGVQP